MLPSHKLLSGEVWIDVCQAARDASLTECTEKRLGAIGEGPMRRMTMLLIWSLMWSSPMFAAQPATIFPRQLCCQYGQTLPSIPLTNTPLPITCSDINTGRQPTSPGGAARACINAGGQVTTGPCNTDGACGGSLVCCAGVSVGESCTQNVATQDSCALTTEAACDALSPAEAQASVSEPGQICVRNPINFQGPSFCQKPIPVGP